MDKSKHYPIDKVRNIGIIAHIDAGKTTTTETVLYYTGKTHKIGKIDEGTTEMDWMEQERERGITIMAAATTCFWKPTEEFLAEDYRINIIDTPGHVDFTAEVERSLRVLDGAVVVFDGKEGVEPQSEKVWRQADKYRIPRLCFVNKLNLTGGDFYMSLSSIKEKLGANAHPLQLPIGTEANLQGAVDLVGRFAYIYTDAEALELKKVEVPDEMKEKMEKYRLELIEKVADSDDEVLQKYLSEQELSENEIRRAIRAATIAGKFFPVLGGDGRKSIVKALLDSIIWYLPSPLDVPAVTGINPDTNAEEQRHPDSKQPFSALAFKVQTDPYVGRLTYFRVYSGQLASGGSVFNSTRRKKERIGRILLMHANKREEIAEVSAGEIGTSVGLKQTKTGDTLCNEAHPIILEAIKFPEPVISVAIEPKTKADQEKMGIALSKLSEEDPTFTITGNPETGETIISGMGELHLEILVDRMLREFKVGANVGAPQVAYRETIRRIVDKQEGKYIRQSGGHGQYGHVVISLEPKNRGEGREFVDKIRGGAIPKNFIPAVEKGVIEALDSGILGGYPLTDIKVTLFDGSFHEVDSSDIAFKIAGSIAVKEGCKQGGAVLLEPIMKVEVVTPEQYMGDVISDLSSKRAQIEETQARGNARVIHALVPLSEMFGYATTVRSLSQGRASFNMEPSHYQELPKNIAEKILSPSTADKS
ncbi:MAG: elongation factor G [Candidatus Cloacimonetes bacterium]|nr:elongation factor G [Candidatus Cloacimonadota bacterium]